MIYERTLQEAIDQVSQQPREARELIIEEGEYFLDAPLRITERHAGLTISGKGNVSLYGGEPIEQWRRENEYLWCANLPEGREWDFRALIVNGRYADRARYPEEGFLIHETDFDVSWRSTFEGGFERQPTYTESTTLKFRPNDIKETLESANAEITVFHMWDESLVGVKDIDWDKNIITFSNPSGWPPGSFAKHYNLEKRYVIWNTSEGMSKPGQWYLDRKNRKVIYWPLPDEDIDKVEIIAPVMENIIIVEGENSEVNDITIENLTLAGTNAPLMSGAFGAKLFDGAISIKNADRCSLHNLKINNVGAHGIKASGDNINISDCHIHHCGAGAIRLVGSYAKVYNNYIHNVGKTFPSAIALYVGATDPNVPEEWEAGHSYTSCSIIHNEIHDVPYAAICAGGKHLKIEKNLIYRAMQDLYDGAGIYITFCENALIKNNFIKEIKDSPGAGTSAYYLDEKTVNCLVEENLEIDVPRPSHNHMSTNNTFRNNFFIIQEKGRLSMERCHGYKIERNVIAAQNGFELYDIDACEQVKNNILFTGNGKLVNKNLDKYDVISEYEMELANGNVNQDPLITNYLDGRITFDKDSPAVQLGIKPIDVSDAGRVSHARNHMDVT